MKVHTTMMTVPKPAIVVICCLLIGCRSRTAENGVETTPVAAAPVETPAQSALNFKEQQKKLFYETDHKLVYQSCQELMRRSRAGKLSGSAYSCDDPAAKWSELPEPLRALGPASVQVSEVMVNMTFFSADGVQSLQCFSNEFGEPQMFEEGTKGLGFRKEPFAMDKLSGQESLDYLNQNYNHLMISLVPGLTYEVSHEDQPQTLEKIKRDAEMMGQMSAIMSKTMDELAVKKQRLLYRTDHQALLEACRESIRRFNEGAFSTGAVRIMSEDLLAHAQPPVDREKYAKDLKQIPEIVLSLEPINIVFGKDRVTIVFMGGFDHAGVVAYANDKEALPRGDDMELIPGLRYYDDGLREAREEWLSYLKSLKHEALSPIDWRRKQMNLPLPVRK
jgi:hypothetical protein